MEGLLELRPPGIMGKWEERYFRLDAESLKSYSADGRSLIEEYRLNELEALKLEVPELNFLCQGRKSRLRSNDERPNQPTIREWHSKLTASIPGMNPDEDEILSGVSPARGGNAKGATAESPQVKDNSNKSRVDMMYEAHKRKLDKLQARRDKEAEEEKKRLQEEFQKTRSKATKGRGKISQSDVKQTADRLFNEHRLIKENLEKRRQDHERQEADRIQESRRMNFPTRSSSDPALLSAKEAGDRLYGDAERRELWRTQARDAQAKEELTMVKIGTRGTGTSSTNRCHDLHKEAAARKEKIEKAIKKKNDEEVDTMCKHRVPVASDLSKAKQHWERLYQEHEEKEKERKRKHKEKVDREREELQANMINPSINKFETGARRKPPPWKDPQYFATFTKEKLGVPQNKVGFSASATRFKETEEHVKKDLAAASMQITHADYGIVAIQAAISLRSGYSHFQIPLVYYKSLRDKLKKIMKCYTDALHQIQQDAGFASLCSRPSQRLFQEHLLPEVEGWSHRLMPDPIRQVEDNLDALLSSAAKAHQALKNEIAPGIPWPTGALRNNPPGVSTAMFAFDPGVKTKEAAKTKALVKYGPGEKGEQFMYRHLTDLSRLQLVFPSCDMLQAGLEHILKKFEVVDVRNYCGNPGRLGLRFVEVLVVMIVKEGRENIPHVCELRLEHQHFNTATQRCKEVRKAFYDQLQMVYQPTHMDLNAVECICRGTLNAAPEGHRLRSFRCHLGRRFGSTVCGWRKALGGGRQMDFHRFREVCYSLNCGEHVTELWQELDPNRGGCISLWELDPDAVSLLVKLRSRMLTVLASTQKGEYDVEDTDAHVLFARLTSFVRPIQLGSLEMHEFRMVAKPLGLSNQEADRAFACLDHFPGSTHAPPAAIDVTDIQWLKRLTSLVDVESVQCAQDVSKEPTIFPSPMPDASSPPPADFYTLDAWKKPQSRGEPPRQQPKSVPNSSPPAAGSAPQGGPSEAWEQQRQEADPQSSKKLLGKPAKPYKDDTIPITESPGADKISLEDAGDLGELGVDVEDDDDDDDDEFDDDEEGEEEEPEASDDEEDDDDEEPAGEETW